MGQGFATKRINLDFAPVAGMRYNDGTWKQPYERTITSVEIGIPGDVAQLTATLEPDDPALLKELRPTYEAHGWEVL